MSDIFMSPFASPWNLLTSSEGLVARRGPHLEIWETLICSTKHQENFTQRKTETVKIGLAESHVSFSTA